MSGFFSSVGSYISGALDFNKATLSGALDVVAVKHDDGRIVSTPFHVRFGKLKLLRSRDKLIHVLVNGEATTLRMTLGDAGEAYFIHKRRRRLPRRRFESVEYSGASISLGADSMGRSSNAGTGSDAPAQAHAPAPPGEDVETVTNIPAVICPLRIDMRNTKQEDLPGEDAHQRPSGRRNLAASRRLLRLARNRKKYLFPVVVPLDDTEISAVIRPMSTLPRPCGDAFSDSEVACSLPGPRRRVPGRESTLHVGSKLGQLKVCARPSVSAAHPPLPPCESVDRGFALSPSESSHAFPGSVEGDSTSNARPLSRTTWHSFSEGFDPGKPLFLPPGADVVSGLPYIQMRPKSLLRASIHRSWMRSGAGMLGSASEPALADLLLASQAVAAMAPRPLHRTGSRDWRAQSWHSLESDSASPSPAAARSRRGTISASPLVPLEPFGATVAVPRAGLSSDEQPPALLLRPSHRVRSSSIAVSTPSPSPSAPLAQNPVAEGRPVRQRSSSLVGVFGAHLHQPRSDVAGGAPPRAPTPAAATPVLPDTGVSLVGSTTQPLALPTAVVSQGQRRKRRVRKHAGRKGGVLSSIFSYMSRYDEPQEESSSSEEDATHGHPFPDVPAPAVQLTAPLRQSLEANRGSASLPAERAIVAEHIRSPRRPRASSVSNTNNVTPTQPLLQRAGEHSAHSSARRGTARRQSAPSIHAVSALRAHRIASPGNGPVSDVGASGLLHESARMQSWGRLRAASFELGALSPSQRRALHKHYTEESVALTSSAGTTSHAMSSAHVHVDVHISSSGPVSALSGAHGEGGESITSFTAAPAPPRRRKRDIVWWLLGFRPNAAGVEQSLVVAAAATSSGTAMSASTSAAGIAATAILSASSGSVGPSTRLAPPSLCRASPESRSLSPASASRSRTHAPGAPARAADVSDLSVGNTNTNSAGAGALPHTSSPAMRAHGSPLAHLRTHASPASASASGGALSPLSSSRLPPLPPPLLSAAPQVLPSGSVTLLRPRSSTASSVSSFHAGDVVGDLSIPVRSGVVAAAAAGHVSVSAAAAGALSVQFDPHAPSDTAAGAALPSAKPRAPSTGSASAAAATPASAAVPAVATRSRPALATLPSRRPGQRTDFSALQPRGGGGGHRPPPSRAAPDTRSLGDTASIGDADDLCGAATDDSDDGDQDSMSWSGNSSDSDSDDLSGGEGKAAASIEGPPSQHHRTVISSAAPTAVVVAAASSSVAPSQQSQPSRRRHRHHYYHVKELEPTATELASLRLRPGPNALSFTVEGTAGATVSSTLFLWSPRTKIVISDVDGTITKSDVLGHVFFLMGRDWTHAGVAQLYSSIAANGYQLLYLTSRAIGQTDATKEYLHGIKQGADGLGATAGSAPAPGPAPATTPAPSAPPSQQPLHATGSPQAAPPRHAPLFQLPLGPVITSPDRLVTAFTREVILRRPQDFKIAALSDVVRLFPAGASSSSSSPFAAGFGNRDTDVLAYRAVGVPASKIFIIDPRGEVRQHCGPLTASVHYRKTYHKLNELVDMMWPAVAPETTQQQQQWGSGAVPRGARWGRPEAATDERFGDAAYWRPHVPALTAADIDDAAAATAVVACMPAMTMVPAAPPPAPHPSASAPRQPTRARPTTAGPASSSSTASSSIGGGLLQDEAAGAVSIAVPVKAAALSTSASSRHAKAGSMHEVKKPQPMPATVVVAAAAKPAVSLPAGLAINAPPATPSADSLRQLLLSPSTAAVACTPANAVAIAVPALLPSAVVSQAAPPVGAAAHAPKPSSSALGRLAGWIYAPAKPQHAPAAVEAPQASAASAVAPEASALGPAAPLAAAPAASKPMAAVTSGAVALSVPVASATVGTSDRFVVPTPRVRLPVGGGIGMSMFGLGDGGGAF